MSSAHTLNKSQKVRIRDLVLTAMFTAIICVMAQISIPIQPIPFTFSLLAIFLTGALLSPRNAFMAVLVYLLLGAFGVPVFAGMKGGLAHLTGYTGGYLAAYPIMSFITSMAYKISKKHKIIGLTAGMLLALVICYLIGTAWFTQVAGTTFPAALATCVFPYVAFDLLKIVLAISFSIVIRKTVIRNM